MKQACFALALGCAALGVVMLARGEPAVAANGPVLLELFTSQGCSSCPPADRLLSELAGTEGVAALSFHVDYWNYIGWTDPFSDRRWSDRQRAYVRSLRGRSAYTPQLVVNGRSDAVGSQPGAVARLLAAAAPLAEIRLSRIGTDGDGLRVRIDTPQLPAAVETLQLWLAVTESGLDTAVPAGENSGRTLHHDHVVRQLRELRGAVGGAAWSGEVAVELQRRWSRPELELVAFQQEPSSRAILAVGVLRPFAAAAGVGR